jgi:hypothetical protein
VNLKSFKKAFLGIFWGLIFFQNIEKVAKSTIISRYISLNSEYHFLVSSFLFFNILILPLTNFPFTVISSSISKLFAQTFLYILNGNLRTYSDLMFAEQSTLPLYI